jgi:hypothetical protein
MKILASLLFIGLSLSGRAQTTNTWTGADAAGYWSAPANWSPAGVPANGNDLVFPSGLPPADMVSTNDLAASFFRSIRFGGSSRHTIRGNSITLTNRSNVIINDGTNVIACDLSFSGTPSVPTFGVVSIRSSAFPFGELTVMGNVGGGSLFVAGVRLVIRGQFTGGSLRQYGGTLALYGDNPHAVAVEVQGDGTTLFVQGSQPNLNTTMLWEMESAACPHLSGDGMVGDVTGCGHITLDSTLSVKNIGRGVCGTCYYNTLTIRLNGTNVGEYGKLVASGDVSLNYGSLLPSAGFNPQAGQIYTIVEKTSAGVITNEFLGPEGTITTLNGMPFRISYVGGDGNDVTLTANTPPVVTWQQPANNAAFPPGFTISLRARATDSDGTVTNVEFFATPTTGPTISVGQGTLASDGYYVRGWTNPPPGQYQLHAEAVDNAGGRGISDSVQIVVVDTSQPPTNAQTRTWTGTDPSGYWSAPANWSPAGVLVNGDTLVFPGGLPPGDMVSTNDLSDRVFRSITFGGSSRHTIRGNPITLTNRSNCILNSGTNVIACDLTFTGTPSTPNYLLSSIRGFQGTPSELEIIGNVGGSGLYVFSERLVIRGQFTGGSLRQQYGSLALYGDNPNAVSLEILGSSYSTLRVQGSQPNLNITMLWEMESATCPALSGDGVVGDVSGCGHITLDSTLSVKNLGHYGGWGGLDIRLNGTNVGEYGRLIASGDVSLSSGSLVPSAGFNPRAGQVFTILEKTSQGAIANAFLGPEGTVTTLNGMPFRISYVGGDGNDVTLTAILPRLNVARTSDPAQVRLSWPTNYPAFHLQRASAITGSAPFSFQDVAVSPVLTGGNYILTAPAATNHEFFRLKQDE